MRPQIKFKTVPTSKLTPEQIAERQRMRAEKKYAGKKALRAKKLAATELAYGLTPEKVNQALLKSKGLLTQAAKVLKIPRTSLMRYIEKNEVCLETLGQARDEMGDVAESRLFRQIEAGDVRCLLYYLSTVHRHRGYGLNAGDAAADPTNRGPVYVETINIVGVESGTFLPRDVALKDTMVIEHQSDGD